MSIIIEPARVYGTLRGRPVRSAHLMSTLSGDAGTRELIAFARALGLHPSWIQYRGQPKEHFDVLGDRKHAAALAAGAELVAPRRLVEVMRAKRTTTTWPGPIPADDSPHGGEE